MEKMPGSNLEFVREDDYVEYFIFPELPTPLEGSSEGNAEQLNALRAHLGTVLEQCNALVQRLVEERQYIWHKDEFQLQLRTGDAQECLLNDERNASTVSLPPHLHGVTHYGDNIADEWFIVFLLSELTHAIAGSIVRVLDADGEFLLIEAADVLPDWASPDTCEQRVYLADGAMQLVQNSPSNTTQVMPVTTAIAKIRQNFTLYRVTDEIQHCIDERVREFRVTPPHNAALHHQILHLPLGVAALLKKRPALIAPAVRAFCERDAGDLKACRTMRYFPPEQRVRTNVRFTRCLYAMLTHTNYVPDRKIGWNLSGATNTESYKEDLLGVKIASGFEILAAQAKSADCDGDNQGATNDPAWRAYVRSLTEKGYFRGNMEGSIEYKRLLAEAESYFQRNNERFRTAPLVGRDILAMLRGSEINAEELRDEENNLQPSDADDWLNITPDQLDAMLNERYGPKKLYKSNGDLDAAEFTKNLTEFLEKQSAFDGIEHADSDDDDGEPDNASKNRRSDGAPAQEAKAKLKKNQSMRKACKERPVAACGGSGASAEEDNGSTHVRNFLDFVIPEDNWDSNSEMSDYEDEDDMERNLETMAIGQTASNIDADIRAYMAQMDKELSRTTIGQTFEKQNDGAKEPTASATATTSTAEDDFDDIEAFEPININVNTLKNMMDSYKSQIGGAGPVSNLLSAMGVGMSAATREALNDEIKDLSESTV